MDNKPETQTEETTVDATATEETEVTESVETGTDETTETEATTEKPLTIDYKAEHDKLQKKIAEDAFKFRKQKKAETSDDDSDEDDSEEDKPLTRAEVARMLAEEKATLAKQFAVKEATTLASSLTSNEDEAQYAVAMWQHVTLPFDTMQEQMEFIVGGMNAKRILAQNSELKRALVSKDTARKNTATTTRDAQTMGQPKTDPQVASVLKTQGYTYNSNQKVYSKKLANGKIMYNDGKGKTWVA